MTLCSSAVAACFGQVTADAKNCDSVSPWAPDSFHIGPRAGNPAGLGLRWCAGTQRIPTYRDLGHLRQHQHRPRRDGRGLLGDPSSARWQPSLLRAREHCGDNGRAVQVLFSRHRHPIRRRHRNLHRINWFASNLGVDQVMRIFFALLLLLAGSAHAQQVSPPSGGALVLSVGATFSTSSCGAAALTGGATAGSFTTTTTGTCTATITMGASQTAPHGWACYANDITSGVAGAQSGGNATTAVLKVASTSGDTLNFGCIGY